MPRRKANTSDFKISLEDVEANVTQAIQQCMVQATEQTRDNLKLVIQPEGIFQSPEAKPHKRRLWGKYANSWSVKQSREKGRYKSTVYNEKHWALTHLLESGHKVKANNEQGYVMTRKFPHIDKERKDCVKRFKKMLEGKL